MGRGSQRRRRDRGKRELERVASPVSCGSAGGGGGGGGGRGGDTQRKRDGEHKRAGLPGRARQNSIYSRSSSLSPSSSGSIASVEPSPDASTLSDLLLVARVAAEAQASTMGWARRGVHSCLVMVMSRLLSRPRWEFGCEITRRRRLYGVLWLRESPPPLSFASSSAGDLPDSGGAGSLPAPCSAWPSMKNLLCTHCRWYYQIPKQAKEYTIRRCVGDLRKKKKVFLFSADGAILNPPWPAGWPPAENRC